MIGIKHWVKNSTKELTQSKRRCITRSEFVHWKKFVLAIDMLKGDLPGASWCKHFNKVDYYLLYNSNANDVVSYIEQEYVVKQRVQRTT